MVKRWKRSLLNETGAVTIVEATVVFPIVFVVLGFLILTSLFLMQKSALYSDVQRIALVASRVKAFPNYSNYGDLFTNAIDFPNEPNPQQLLESSIEANLYRYWQSDGTELPALEAAFKQLVAKNKFILPDSVHCSIVAKRSLLQEEIVVKASNLVELPRFVTFIGLERAIGIDVIVVATVCDPAEFTRNTDMAFDFATFLSEKTKAGNQIAVFLEDFKSAFEKLKK